MTDSTNSTTVSETLYDVGSGPHDVSIWPLVVILFPMLVLFYGMSAKWIWNFLGVSVNNYFSVRPPWRWFIIHPCLVVHDELFRSNWMQQVPMTAIIVGFFFGAQDVLDLPVAAKYFLLSIGLVWAFHSALMSHFCQTLGWKLMYELPMALASPMGMNAQGRQTVQASRSMRNSILFTPIHFIWGYFMINLDQRVSRQFAKRVRYGDSAGVSLFSRYSSILVSFIVGLWLYSLPTFFTLVILPRPLTSELNHSFLCWLSGLTLIMIVLLGWLGWKNYSTVRKLLPESILSHGEMERRRQSADIVIGDDAPAAPPNPPSAAIITGYVQLSATDFHDVWELFQRMWSYILWHAYVKQDMLQDLVANRDHPSRNDHPFFELAASSRDKQSSPVVAYFADPSPDPQKDRYKCPLDPTFPD